MSNVSGFFKISVNSIFILCFTHEFVIKLSSSLFFLHCRMKCSIVSCTLHTSQFPSVSEADRQMDMQNKNEDIDKTQLIWMGTGQQLLSEINLRQHISFIVECVLLCVFGRATGWSALAVGSRRRTVSNMFLPIVARYAQSDDH